MEGWTRRRPGWMVIARKEFTDHILSGRFVALLVILSLVAMGTVYTAAGALRDAAPQTAGLEGNFLRLFTVSGDLVPFSFLTFLGFLAPILGIAFGFDSVNGERAQGTLPRLVAQPIHRDDVINGKFAAGLGVVGVTMTLITIVVGGLGIFLLGIVPTTTEVVRILIWLAVAIVFVGVWLAMAVLCSVWMERAATSATVSIGIWLIVALFGSLLAQLAADVISPVNPAEPMSALSNAETELTLSRMSPIVLYGEAATALLNPGVRTLGFVTIEQVDRTWLADLGLGQSLLLAWPQLVVLMAFTVVLFAVAYVRFMRQEVRA
jgi:ABC-2 type transport system permease protein